MVNRVFKSIMYLILSVFVIYFLGGVSPKMINLLPDPSTIRTFCVTVYWVSILAILGVPQYVVYMTEQDITIIAPIISMGSFVASFLAVVGSTLVINRLLNAITLSDTSYMIFYLCYWIFVLGIFYVPQIFVFAPLKEMHGIE